MTIVDKILERDTPEWVQSLTADQGLPGRIAEQLRTAICEGSLAPGQRISEEELAEAFGTSRTPVREAIRILSAEGLVVLAPRRGASVSAIAPERAADVYLCRAYLYGLAAKLAAVRRTDQHVAELRGLIAELRNAAESADRALYLRGMAAFNQCVVDAAGSATIADALAPLNVQALRYRHLTVTLPDRMQRSLRNYKRIADAVSQQRAETAEKAARHAIAEPVDELLVHLAGAARGKQLSIGGLIDGSN